MPQRVDRAGYFTVRLSKKGKDSTVSVHRLLGFAFLENPKLSFRQMRDSFDFFSLDIENLLFQTGYLTLDQELPIDPPSDSHMFFSLSFPNHEVKSAFTNVLLKSLREKEMTALLVAHRFLPSKNAHRHSGSISITPQ